MDRQYINDESQPAQPRAQDPAADTGTQLRRLKEVIEQQQQQIQELQRDLRRLRGRVDDHAQVITGLRRG
jgi:prefoldin subunit 5